MKEWPADDRELVDFTELCMPLVRAMRHCYRLERRNVDVDVAYDGLNIGRDERAGCLPADRNLSAEYLRFVEDDQGRDALTEIIGLAVRLGLEQGRRMARSDRPSALSEELLAAIDEVAIAAGEDAKQARRVGDEIQLRLAVGVDLEAYRARREQLMSDRLAAMPAAERQAVLDRLRAAIDRD